MSPRPELVTLIERLVGRGAAMLTLDEISEAIGAMPIALDEIDWVIESLEERGITAGDPSRPPASTHLGEVLRSARQLRSKLGRTPSPVEIAEQSGLTIDDVRMALLAVKILQR